jgi:nitroreductase
MVLKINELGLGTCWVCNFNPRVIQEKMALREGLEPVVLLPLGYPQVEETDGGNKKRKSLKEITEWI